MTALEDLLVMLVDTLPTTATDPEAGLRLEVSSVALALPIESRLGHDGTFRACAPRGQIVTGFDLPHGTLAVVFARGGG